MLNVNNYYAYGAIFYTYTQELVDNLEVERLHIIELNEENSDKQSHLNMKLHKIDKMEKQMKLIAKKYQEVREKVCH